MNSILAVDVGNTTIGLCLFLKLEDSISFFIKKIPTHPAKSTEAYKKIICEFMNSKFNIQNSKKLVAHCLSSEIDSVISSVVQSINMPITSAIKEIIGKEPLVVSHKLDCGLAFDVKHPEKVGADRIANALAGFDYFKKPVAVVDFGTATTITVVGKHNSHPVLLGGAIMPGINLMQRSLHESTSKLPSTLLKKPKTALGKNTVSAITSGILFGTAGAIETLIKNMEKELNFRLKLILTGGHAKLMSSLIKRKHSLEPDLTFQGLRLIYMKARGSNA